MRLMSLPTSDMSAGDEDQPLLEGLSGDKMAIAICYEDAYGAEQLYALPEASVLINVSNDAWFGETLAPHQHLECQECGKVIEMHKTGRIPPCPKCHKTEFKRGKG